MTGVVVVSTGCKGGSVGKKRGGGGGEEAEERERQQLSVLALLLAAVRRSVVACRVERGPDRVASGGGGCRWGEDDEDAAAPELAEMEIGWPTDVRHVAHVTFDRFHGFLGLPVEFEVEMPPRVPSASASVFGVSAESMQCTYDGKGNSVPTILLLMQERLYAQGGLKAEGIFRINPENDQEEHVRDQLNKGVVPEDIDVHCLASLIKAWFRELPEGVLDSLSPEQVLQCNSEEEFLELVTLLRPTPAALLNWAVELMADVVEEEELNKMNARNIAMVFAPNMTQMSDPLTALMHAVQVMNFLKTLILRTLRERDDVAPGDYTPYSSPASSGRHSDAEYYGSEREMMDRSCELSDMHSQISKSGGQVDYLVRYNTCFDSEQEADHPLTEAEEVFLDRLESQLEDDRPEGSTSKQHEVSSEIVEMEDDQPELKSETKALEDIQEEEEGAELLK
ncbi:rho GTPase-activating protein 5 [Aegilops tauschii subsp. strangulata]|uniref:Rho-GAP domain-containing protein n=4 Tax=Aegilops tauschii TaxID=37682 RepID=A0A453K1G5_AEGTS|nr:rho GTPase-activating protein 2 [Aegilops tauschii subsp. strangulata]